jgi:tetracycline resistance efflux pump
MGIYTLIPPLVVVLLGIWTRRAFEPLLIGCLVGFVMINPAGFPGNFIEALKKTLQQEDMVWIILVCGLYGSMIHLIIQSGSVLAFGDSMLRYVKTRRSALAVSWLMGVFIFIDDYMSALATGVTMRKITDNYRISREMLAFMVSATAAPICLLIPMSTWSIYGGSLLESNKIVEKGHAFEGFINTIPFMFYPWVIVTMALLVALGIFPVIGTLKIAEQNALDKPTPVGTQTEAILPHKSKSIHFLLPLSILIAATLWLEKDALKGVLAGITFTFLYYWMTKVLTFEAISDGIFDGFKSMIVPLGILTMSYVLKKVGDEMGLTPYIIECVKPILSKGMLPMIVFLALSFISYTTASSWGLYAVAIPIVIPLAQAVGCNVGLALAAVFSSGAFGSQASFFSDVTVLTASSTECPNVKLSFAQLPYSLMALGISALLFLICGFYF